MNHDDINRVGDDDAVQYDDDGADVDDHDVDDTYQLSIHSSLHHHTSYLEQIIKRSTSRYNHRTSTHLCTSCKYNNGTQNNL
jgi:hypothetical protein